MHLVYSIVKVRNHRRTRRAPRRIGSMTTGAETATRVTRQILGFGAGMAPGQNRRAL